MKKKQKKRKSLIKKKIFGEEFVKEKKEMSV